MYGNTLPSEPNLMEEQAHVFYIKKKRIGKYSNNNFEQ